MDRAPNYYDGYAGPNPIGGPAGDTVYAAGPAGYGGFKVEQHQQQLQQPAPYGHGSSSNNNSIGSPTKRKAAQVVYPDQSMRLGTPAAADADGDYEYDMNTYGASRSRDGGGLSAGDYDENSSDMATVRLQNRNGKDVRMVINNHSNMNVPLDQSAGSSVTSNEYAPPTPSGDAGGYGGGYSTGGAGGSVDSPPDGQKGAGSVASNPNSNTASSPTESSRKKQKRNKPTLSCSECVERKTKVAYIVS